MTENTKTTENKVQTTENNPTTYKEVVETLKNTLDIKSRYEVTTTKIDLSQIPQYTLIQSMKESNPNLNINDACKVLDISEENTKKIIDVLDYYNTQETQLKEIETLMTDIKTMMIEKDILKSQVTTRAPKTSGGQRKKICGHFYAKCPKCEYVAKGKERSLVTNQIKLHMMREHGLTLDQFNELYRNTVNDSIKCDGETWVEYY